MKFVVIIVSNCWFEFEVKRYYYFLKQRIIEIIIIRGLVMNSYSDIDIVVFIGYLIFREKIQKIVVELNIYVSFLEIG